MMFELIKLKAPQYGSCGTTALLCDVLLILDLLILVKQEHADTAQHVGTNGEGKVFVTSDSSAS